AGQTWQPGGAVAPDSAAPPACASRRMTLEPGCRFVVAPHFHLRAEWPGRLLVGAGVEEAGGCFFPRKPGRPPTADELPLLVQASDGPTAGEDLEACVCLFQLPI